MPETVHKKSPHYFRSRGVSELPTVFIHWGLGAIAGLLVGVAVGFGVTTLVAVFVGILVAGAVGVVLTIVSAKKLGASWADAVGISFLGWPYKIWLKRRHAGSTQTHDRAHSAET